MLEIREAPELPLEAIHGGGMFPPEELHGDGIAAVAVARLVDHAEAPFAEPPHDLEARHQHHVVCTAHGTHYARSHGQ
ncbi:MAG TPA: hypothetical protein VHZ95_23150 [Polyangiales bacterium]|nr:hypothetical protein [Polyangiales bacterium]